MDALTLDDYKIRASNVSLFSEPYGFEYEKLIQVE